MPAQEVVRTGLPGQLEHFVAYAGSAAIGVAGYGPSQAKARSASSGAFASTPACWNTSSISRPAGIRGSRISPARPSERCAAGSLSTFFGPVPPIGRGERLSFDKDTRDDIDFSSCGQPVLTGQIAARASQDQDSV
jgi:hypothetical protein